MRKAQNNLIRRCCPLHSQKKTFHFYWQTFFSVHIYECPHLSLSLSPFCFARPVPSSTSLNIWPFKFLWFFLNEKGGHKAQDFFNTHAREKNKKKLEKGGKPLGSYLVCNVRFTSKISKTTTEKKKDSTTLTSSSKSSNRSSFLKILYQQYVTFE